MIKAMVRKHDGAIIAHPLLMADTFASRLRGLLGKTRLAPREGLLITPCRDVHTCGMRFSIDIVFLDRDFQILKLTETSRNWRFYSGGRACQHVLELGAGAISNFDLQVGDALELNGVPDYVSFQ